MGARALVIILRELRCQIFHFGDRGFGDYA